MKHSNICYISRINAETKKHEFAEVDGITVKNSYGLDLFRYKPTPTSDYYVVTEGQTGCAICEIRKDSTGGSIRTPKEIDKYLETFHRTENKPIHEMIKSGSQQRIEQFGLSPRYTEPDKRRAPKPKKAINTDGLQRGRFFISCGRNGVREISGYLYSTDGLNFGLQKFGCVYSVTELSTGSYVGQIPKELPQDWQGFSRAREYVKEMRSENPQHFADFESECRVYQERINKHMGVGNEKLLYTSVKEMRNDIGNRVEPVYYIIERPTGERFVRKFLSFSGGRFNSTNAKGEEILGLEMKNVKFTPNGFIIDGFVFDFRVNQNDIDEFKNAIENYKIEKEKQEADEQRQRENEKRQQEDAFNSVLDKAERSLFEFQEVANNDITMPSGTNSTIVAELMKRYDIKIPLKTHGWINKQLVSVFFSDKYTDDENPSGICYRFYKGHNSTTFYDYLQRLDNSIRIKMGSVVNCSAN